jgi:hypothetical protein
VVRSDRDSADRERIAIDLGHGQIAALKPQHHSEPLEF